MVLPPPAPARTPAEQAQRWNQGQERHPGQEVEAALVHCSAGFQHGEMTQHRGTQLLSLEWFGFIPEVCGDTC